MHAKDLWAVHLALINVYELLSTIDVEERKRSSTEFGYHAVICCLIKVKRGKKKNKALFKLVFFVKVATDLFKPTVQLIIQSDGEELFDCMLKNVF